MRGRRPSGWIRARRWAPAIGVASALVFLVGWPLVELLRVAGEEWRGGLGDAGGTMRLFGNTVLVGGLAAVVTVALGTGAALVTERTPAAGRRWLRLGLVLPFLVPPFVSALSWLRAYGPSGLMDDALGIEMPGVFGPAGVIAVISINAMPLAYLLAVAALTSRAGRDFELAGRVSGAGPLTVARTVTLPLLAPALLGAAALVFVLGINAFGVPQILGTPASFEVVTTRIYQDLARSAQPEAFSRAILLATGLVLLAFVFTVIADVLLSGVGRGRRTAATDVLAGRRGRPRRGLTVATWAIIAVVTIIPLVVLVLVALTKGVGVAPTPGNWTLANFAEAIDGRLVGALGRSLLLAVLAATGAVLLGAAVALLRRRYTGRAASFAVMLGFAVPGSTLAVAMLLSYGSVLRDTLTIILLAYLAKLWAVGHRSLAGSAGNLPPDLVFAARASGATPVTALRTVVAPLLRPAIVGGWLLVFLIAFHELTMSSLLYGPGTDTVAVAVLNLQQLGDVPVSSALAVILTLPLIVAAVPLLATSRLSRRLLGNG